MKRVDNIRDDKFSFGNAEDYRALLKNILRYYKIRPLRGYPVNGHICYLRHDVDYSISGAVQMAKIEREEGITSTYYILQTAAYFRGAKEKIRKIRELGHEIGLHHNFISPFIRKKGQVNAQPLFLSQLNKLRGLGINVKTVAAHGDPLCHKFGISNYQIFSECPPQLEKNDVFPMKLSLKEHGLREAYFLKRDCYITDSAGGWRHTFNQYVNEWNGKFSQVKEITEFIDFIGEREKANILLLLTHPCWWRLYEDKSD